MSLTVVARVNAASTAERGSIVLSSREPKSGNSPALYELRKIVDAPRSTAGVEKKPGLSAMVSRVGFDSGKWLCRYPPSNDTPKYSVWMTYPL